MIVDNTVIPVQNTTMDTTKADLFFKSFPKDKVVSYKEYWESIRPNNNDEIFRRYLFSFMSVHTTWKSNVAGYNACLLYTSPSPRDGLLSRMPSSA